MNFTTKNQACGGYNNSREEGQAVDVMQSYITKFGYSRFLELVTRSSRCVRSRLDINITIAEQHLAELRAKRHDLFSLCD